VWFLIREIYVYIQACHIHHTTLLIEGYKDKNLNTVFIIGIVKFDKKWGLKGWKTLDFKKWVAELSSLIEVYAYGYIT